jgi:hypothetical protein
VAVSVLLNHFLPDTLFLLPDTFFAGYIFSNFVMEIGLLLVSKTPQCELFCSHLSAFAFIDRNLLRSLQSCFSMIGILCPPSVWIVLSTPFRLDFVCPIFWLAFID